MIAEKWDISRDQMEAFAFASHERAIQAIDEGRFDNEIVPVGDCTMDEGLAGRLHREDAATLDARRRRRITLPSQARSPMRRRRC